MQIYTNNSKDKTIERNTIARWKHLITEYELVKLHQHPKYHIITDFYRMNGIIFAADNVLLTP